MLDVRSCGILCHVSSLPSRYGIGDLGPEAFAFVDALARAGQRWWQILPLNPVEESLGNSPYSSASAFGFNTLLVSPEELLREGYLEPADMPEPVAPGPVDFPSVREARERLLDTAVARYRRRGRPERAFLVFCESQAFWLEDHALFQVLKRKFSGRCWQDWPLPLRGRNPAALAEARREEADGLLREKFAQYLFYRQWMTLQGYCSRKGIGVIGDIPIYVNYDSADVWGAPRFFKLDAEGRPVLVSGVPPDYFSAEGQRWGNPVYDWEALRADRFSWWADRVRHQLTLFDAVRIDHFRAFAQCWEIPASEPTAVRGRWSDVPGGALFEELERRLGPLPVIAEDLGIITPDVDALKDRFGFPGMRVLMFAFHGETFRKNRDLPENHPVGSIVYTGTHDNNTIAGWFEHDRTPRETENMKAYFGELPASGAIVAVMVRAALQSPAALCVLPLADVLGLGSEARMNCPSTMTGNWRWRMMPGALDPETTRRLLSLTAAAHRTQEHFEHFS